MKKENMNKTETDLKMSEVEITEKDIQELRSCLETVSQASSRLSH